MTLEEFFSLLPIMEVCVFYPKFSYHSQPIFLKEDTFTSFKLNIAQKSKCIIALHQVDDRRNKK